MSPAINHYKLFSEKLGALKDLVTKLPRTVFVATKNDRIFQVFTAIPVPADSDKHWEVFNRRMDSLFGEDVRDEQGRLTNVKRGEYGMDMVVKYVEEAIEAGFLFWDIGLIKIEHLIAEIQNLM